MADVPWTDPERLELFGEIIKAAKVPPMHLFSLIQAVGGVPDWRELPLPRGRSYNSCVAEYTKWADSGNTSQPTPASDSHFSQFLTKDGQSFAANRHLQPKNTELESCSGNPAVNRSEATIGSRSEVKKKRGRPTKIETEARRRAALARGEPYPAPRSTISSTPRKSLGSQAVQVSQLNSQLGAQGVQQIADDLTTNAAEIGKKQNGRVDPDSTAVASVHGIGQSLNSHTPPSSATYQDCSIQPDLRSARGYATVSAGNLGMARLLEPSQSDTSNLALHQHVR